VVKDVAPLGETSTRASLAVGQVGVFKNGSATAIDGTTDLAAGDKFKVVFKDVDGYIIESPMYDYNLITSKRAANYAAGTEQKSYIGYNGTSGSIAVKNSDVYHVHVIRKDWSKTWNEHGSFKLAGVYESDASATQTEIALGLLRNMVKNFEIEKAKSGVTVTTVGLINSASVVLTNDFSGTATITQGSNVLSVTNSGQYATNTDVVVGDYIRISPAYNVAVALTNDVYQIVALSGTTTKLITLDRKVTKASGTYATGTGTEVIPKATAEAANWGISIESAPVKFIPGKFKYQNVTFDITLSEAFGATPITQATAPYKGIGTYKEIAEIEWELRNNQREAFHVASYPVTENLNATLGKTYDVINVDFMNDNARTLNGKDYSFHSLIIASEDESVATVFTQLKDILNIT